MGEQQANTDLPPSMLPLSVSGYFPHNRLNNHTANIYKRRSCGNSNPAVIQHQQPVVSSSKRRNIYQQRDAQSCDDLLGSSNPTRLTSQNGKSEYALNEASFYARVSLDRLREVKQMKVPNSAVANAEHIYPPPPDQFCTTNNRGFSDIQKSKSFHRIQPFPPRQQLYAAASPIRPVVRLTSNHGSLDNRHQPSENPYMAHIYPKNFISTPPRQQESIYQVIQPAPVAADSSISQEGTDPTVTTTSSSSGGAGGSNRTSATISEEAVTRFGETEDSGSEQM